MNKEKKDEENEREDEELNNNNELKDNNDDDDENLEEEEENLEAVEQDENLEEEEEEEEDDDEEEEEEEEEDEDIKIIQKLIKIDKIRKKQNNNNIYYNINRFLNSNIKQKMLLYNSTVCKHFLFLAKNILTKKIPIKISATEKYLLANLKKHKGRDRKILFVENFMLHAIFERALKCIKKAKNE